MVCQAYRQRKSEIQSKDLISLLANKAKEFSSKQINTETGGVGNQKLDKIWVRNSKNEGRASLG